MNLFGLKNKSKDQGGSLRILGNHLFCKGREGTSPLLHNDKIDLSQLTAVYFVINEYGTKDLWLNADAHYFIPVSFRRFDKVFHHLSKLYPLDIDLFYRFLDTKKPVKVRLWRKQFKANYHILADGYNDIASGFEVQSPQKEFVSWDMPLRELKQAPFVKIRPLVAVESSTLSFKYPVRIGPVLLDQLGERLYKNRPNVPALYFSGGCYNAANSVESYWELKECFSAQNGMVERGGYEREDQKHWCFYADGMRFELTYWLDSARDFDLGYTALSVSNIRDYTALLENPAYEAKMVISQKLVLKDDAGVHILGDYKKDSRIKRCPPLIAKRYGNNPVIWQDEVNKTIGFSRRGLAVILDDKELESIAIENILPAKGGGYGTLKLSLKSERYRYSVLQGACHAFDEYAEKIAQITGKEVTFLPEGNDC